jgi:hypothetical protein
MDIPEHVKRAHESLSFSSVKFLDFVGRNPASLQNSNFDMLRLNDELIRLQPWPTFINRDRANQMAEACINICGLIKSIFKGIFNNDPYKISQYYGIPAGEVEFRLDGADETHMDNLIARGDFILTATGLKCLEFNITAYLGGLQIPFWKSLYLNTPIIRKFFREYGVKIYERNLLSILIEHLLDTAAAKFSDYKGEMNAAIVIPGYKGEYYPMELYLNEMYKKKLLEKNRKRGGRIILCDGARLRVVNDCLFYEQEKIHSLVEMCHGDVLLEILTVFKAGNTCLYNGPITGLLSSKLNLANLSEHEDSPILNPQEREIIKKNIPWTRKLIPGETVYRMKKVKLEDFILSNRVNLVIKPGGELGGADVYIGKHTVASKWRDKVEFALKEKNWVVQEYVESRSYLYQCGEEGCAEHKMVLGFFVFGSKFAGIDVRVLPVENSTGVINAHQGAVTSVVFETEE